MVFCDIELAARIERAEAQMLAGAAHVIARRVADVIARPLCGGFAVFTEAGSPLNKVVGLGMSATFDDASFVALEQELFARGAAVQVELRTLAEPSVAPWLTAHGYQLVGVENVLGCGLPATRVAFDSAEIQSLSSNDAGSLNGFQIVRVEPNGSAFCFGDGLDLKHSTACPCGNTGSPGNGCANSANPAGANLAGSGSVAADNVQLRASGLPTATLCVFFQGDALDDTVFGDGVRCTGGALLRLRWRPGMAGAVSFPDATDTVTLSQRGDVTVGSGATRFYQTHYRNPAAAWCPPETFNVTNGWRITW